MQRVPDLVKVWLFLLVGVTAVVVRLDVVRTARLMVTAQVEIADALDVLTADSSDHADEVKLKQVVVMPGVPLRMSEDGDVREVVVMINDVGQVHHCLVTLIFGRVELGFGVVGHIYRMLHVAQPGLYPRRILFPSTGDYECFGVFASAGPRFRVGEFGYRL